MQSFLDLNIFLLHEVAMGVDKSSGVTYEALSLQNNLYINSYNI